tara:strand:+ start:583 stop:735 length:153 start_codon:yes stop_codon:yes gene_type:complete
MVMELVVPIIIGLIVLFIAIKLLKGVVKTFGIVIAIAIAAGLYFAMGGGA